MSKHEDQVRAAAAAEHRWTESDVEVSPLASVELPACRLFTAFHKTRPSHVVATYAVVPSGEIVGQNKEDALDVIVRDCDLRAARADTWAELVQRFRPSAGPGRVLYAEEPEDTRITAPKLEGNALKFFVRDIEADLLFEVTANVTNAAVTKIESKTLE